MDNSNILNYITTIVYDSKKESFEQFLDKFEVLWQQLENMGNVQSEQNKINHLVTAIKRSTKDYDLTMQIAQRSKCTLQELKRDLHAKEVELRVDHHSKNNGRNGKSNGKDSKGKKRRSKENKVNKTNEDAKACYKCGSDKHLFKNCPQLTKKARVELTNVNEKSGSKSITNDSGVNNTNSSNGGQQGNQRMLKGVNNNNNQRKLRYETSSTSGNNNSSRAPPGREQPQ
jgi:hypothetical protein